LKRSESFHGAFSDDMLFALDIRNLFGGLGIMRSFTSIIASIIAGIIKSIFGTNETQKTEIHHAKPEKDLRNKRSDADLLDDFKRM